MRNKILASIIITGESAMPDVKLLTEAEAHWLANAAKPSEAQAFLRERGLIAPEPVDPLLIEARNVVADYAAGTRGYQIYEASYREGKRDSDSEIQVALAALRRGMELRPELTREDVREALDVALPCEREWWLGELADRLHTALVERMK